ncbi:VOC family protein [Nonomuraea sp. NPDC003707]
MREQSAGGFQEGKPTTPPISGLHHFALTVRDLEASIAWYQKVFQATLVDGDLPHYGREWTGYANLVIEPRTGLAIGLHHHEANQDEEFDEVHTGLDHISRGCEPAFPSPQDAGPHGASPRRDRSTSGRPYGAGHGPRHRGTGKCAGWRTSSWACS